MLSEDLISLTLKHFPAGLCAVDLETTGLSPSYDKIVEIAGVKIKPNGEVVTMQSLVNPEMKIPEKTIAIHQITDDMVKDAPKFSELGSEVLNFFEDLPIIAHNAHYDLSFLIHQMLTDKIDLPKSKVFCSYHFSKAVMKGLKSYKLSRLITHFKLGEENTHRALADAQACLHVFAKLLEYIDGDDAVDVINKKAYLLDVADYREKDIWKVPERLNQLKENLRNPQQLEIRYLGGSMRNQWRPIKPQSFLPLPSGLILKAKCLLSNDVKSFIVKKIIEVRKAQIQS